MLLQLKKQIQQHETNLQLQKVMISSHYNQLVNNYMQYLRSPKTLLCVFAAGFSWGFMRPPKVKTSSTQCTRSSVISKISSIIALYHFLKQLKLFAVTSESS